MKHGPIALVTDEVPTVAIAVKDSVYPKVISNIQEIRARRGKIIAIATEGDKDIKKHCEDVVYVSDVNELLTPLLTVIPLQLLAYHIADMRECDVDKPRNLAKSVTVE
jgi:glucosamine--fructose-6-phosphate aminotransferase (isomerizing)